MEHMSVEELLAWKDLAKDKPQEALGLLREYQGRFGQDPNFTHNLGGLLIDLGADLNRRDLVEEGVQQIEEILGQTDENTTLLYNLANGYSELSRLERRQQGADYVFDPDNTPLFSAKHHYREALSLAPPANRDFHARHWINYGNCLSGLGRAVEAMSAYNQALRLSPDHPMAQGNLGVEIQHFARIADHPIFLLDARDLLDQALSSEQLEKYGGLRVRRYFDQIRQNTATMLSELGLEQDVQREDGVVPFSSDYEREYVEFCARHQLYLNFCLDCRRCEKYARDSLTFSLITAIDDDRSFVRLSRVINEIKERYAFARFLLLQSTNPILDTIPFDSRTSYVDNLDYAVYGTRVASLKLAFESAYNILDKIAHFINDYLDLGVAPGPGVAFATNGRIWRSRGSNSLRQEIVETENWRLFGLYDLARDLDIDHRDSANDGYWGKLRRTRNSLTHEYLILHVEGTDWPREADGAHLHLHYVDFAEQTIHLLQLVRAAIIYLVAFIDEEERKKHRSSAGFVASMTVRRYDATLFMPALDNWK